MKKTMSVFLSSFLLCLCAQAQASVIVDLTSVADTMVKSALPSTNYGSSNPVEVSYYPGTNDEEGQYTASVFKFDLSSIPNNAEFLNVGLYAKSFSSSYATGHPDARTVSVHFVEDDSWQESTLTWNTVTGADPMSLDTVTYSGSSLWSWDLFANGKPDDTEEELDDDDDFISLALLIDRGDILASVQFESKESSEANWPYLRVEYDTSAVPEPATMMLFGFGAIGAFFRRKK